MISADGLNKKIAYGALADFYAALLTEKQRDLLSMYCDEDLSLSEIAQREDISRQAVSEHLNRAYQRLDSLEAQLRMYARFRDLRSALTGCLSHLSQVKATADTAAHLARAQDILRRHMNEEEA